MTLHARLLSRLREELAITEKAHPGPWVVQGYEMGEDERFKVESGHWSDEEPGICGDHSKAWRLLEDDANLIARSRTLLPALLRGLIVEVERHRESKTERYSTGAAVCRTCLTLFPCAAVRRWADVLGVS